ncbi:YebC/PmpR family DNA-binding transcriptional regulator [Candidatus Venteria ishoeyi]|uniref:Probable transcriptional regulatory protein MBHS_03472 n=1 Tax=Candidatus Venteria ishoeyi TaxID=1899563 RepID=A0A1H6FEK4_9GAMM|nr:YebC/PmpR family DNA-binding transcriptional regulator [Candidatus Venteria ishoeyi]MDM8545509.1 YebC/PmpR family DNA-binding transcriptional regulator [Candidatus Venteria ishoeyi]SEH07596.1 Transcriptional regulatory protein PmpR [Candidatus Venteria ishoeyi]
MAGHSKWANIKHRKGAQDAKRGKLFTRLIREITVAAKMGDPEPNNNPRLRLAVDKGLSANMPKDTIERAIKRGAGATEGDDYEEIRYEGYAPGGVAVMVDCMTDNRNRTVAEVRHAFTKCGGNLGTGGSVAYLFEKIGVISYVEGADEEAIMDVALEAGADDVASDDDGSVDVLTNPDDFLQIKDALKEAGLEPDDAEVTMRASVQPELGLKDAEKVVRMVGMLEELDDVQEVYSNASIADDILEQL